jgi:thiol:disulfide interchange protein DsbD
VLLIAVAIWIVSLVLPAMAQMLAWGAFFIGSAMFYARSTCCPSRPGWWRLWASAHRAGRRHRVHRRRVSSAQDVMAARRPESPPVARRCRGYTIELEGKLAPGKTMLDFYADWCVSCKEMEAFTFSDPNVRAQLDRMLLLQVDVTANTEADKALLKRFSLFGPPGIIFFDPQGREIKGLRVIGYQGPDRFLKTLNLATAP